MPDRPGLDDDDALKELIALWRDGSADIDSQLAEVYRQIRVELASIGTNPNARNAVRRLRIQGDRLTELGDVAARIVDDATIGTRRFIDEGGLIRIYSAGPAAASLPFSFTLPHRNAVEALARDLFDDVLTMSDFVDSDSREFVQRVGRQLTGFKLTSGTPVKTQARRLSREIGREFRSRGVGAVVYRDGSRHSFGEYAEMLLRTKTGVAYNDGTLRAGRAAGIRFYELLDGANCGLTAHHDPELANGLIVPFEVASAFPLSHPNAFLGGQRFRSVEALRQVVRAGYHGPAIRIRTAEQDGFSVTPDHPVLAGRGWVVAKSLRPGDHVLSYNLGGESDPGAYFQNRPVAEDGFTALGEVGRNSRVVPASDDLHGAAVFCEPDVDVVDVKSLLWPHLDSLGLEGTRQGHLPGALMASALDRLGSPNQSRSTVDLPAPGFMGGADLGLSFGAGGVGPPGSHRIASAWHIVTSVESFTYRGLVYDATTAGECYTVGSYVVANCRRSVNPRPDVTAENVGDAVSVQSPEAREDQRRFEEGLRRQAQRPRGRRQRRSRRQRRPRAPRGREARQRAAVAASRPNVGNHADSVDWSTPQAEKALAEGLAAVDKLHGVRPGTQRPRMMWAKGNQNKGGHFTPATRPPKPKRPARSKRTPETMAVYQERLAAWRASPLAQEIRVVARTGTPDGSELVSLWHEMGHWQDFDGKTFIARIAEGATDVTPEIEAMRAFIAGAQQTKAYEAISTTRYPAKFKSYLRQPIELWARAYAQWVTERTGHTGAKAGIRHWVETNPGTQWDDDDFASLVPLVEGVLRARGVLYED